MDPIYRTEIRKVLRVRKEDSAFIYTVFEANEGLGSYSTLPHQVGDAYRDLELRIPETLLPEALVMLASIQEWVMELETTRIEPASGT